MKIVKKYFFFLFLIGLFSCSNEIKDKVIVSDYSYIYEDATFKMFAIERSKLQLVTVQIDPLDYQIRFSECKVNNKNIREISNCLNNINPFYSEYFDAYNKSSELLQDVKSKFPDYFDLDPDTKYSIMKSAGAYEPNIISSLINKVSK